MTNGELIESLIDGGYLKSPRIIEAFRKIDRKEFVPEELKEYAYVNEPLSIGYGQTISQPLTVAFMLELLDPRPDQKILDVGAGSGWQTAMLGYISARSVLELDAPAINPKVIGMERIPELLEFAKRNVEKYGFLERGIVELVLGDATKGVPADIAPVYGFDRIIAAASGNDVPLIWKRQLAVNGRIVAPVEDSIVVFEKHANDAFTKQEYHGFHFVPLVKD